MYSLLITKKRVLLVYISPNQDKLEELHASVKQRSINQDVYIGVLSKEASMNVKYKTNSNMTWEHYGNHYIIIKFGFPNVKFGHKRLIPL